MNSFETDLKRAVFSRGFAVGLILEIVILKMSGFKSDLFYVSVPVIASFPYAAAWLLDIESGILKACLIRSSVFSYITGKILACGISGGLCEMMGCFIYGMIGGDAKEINLLLIFFNGMLWAVMAAALAAVTGSRYIAYGGAFVICYMMVIIHERYFENIYCLYPYEWLAPSHTWIFGTQGVLILLMGMVLILMCIYYEVLYQKIKNI